MSLKKITMLLLTVICIVLCSNDAFSQTTAADIKKIRVDELSDDQIRLYLAQFKASGLSEEQMEEAALAQGMDPGEVRKLRARVDKLKNEGKSKSTSGNTASSKGSGRGTRELNYERDSIPSRKDTLSVAQLALSELRSKIFGADIFKNENLSFEPNLRLATPPNYQIGPDDELLIDIYGYSEASYELKVSPEGTINIPYIGIIQVGGLSVEAATSKIKSRLATIYSGIRSGNTNVSIAIGNIRSIKVILTGEVVKPGTYTLPSLATVFNALYSSGGPTENGSFRQIEVIRGGRRLATLDLYDFLLTGQLKNNLQLRDQDVIRIPTYRKRVEIIGQVKRPGIFEMLPGEKFSDLLRFTGDFNERAYQGRIKVLKNTATERKISDITTDQYLTYLPESGDKFFVDEILDRFENRVRIQGAVYREGEYELEPGLTVKQLIQKAEGLQQDAFMKRAYITRLGSDMQAELVAFDPEKILSGEAPDILLKREDVVRISSIFELKENYSIRVEGEVQRPGTLTYAEGMSLEDAIIQSGGLKEGATPQRIEVSRRVKASDALSSTAQIAEVFQVNIGRDLTTSIEGFKLQPFDIVVVRPSSGYQVQRLVRIDGEVLYPGTYIVSNKNERISDLIKRAGGFTALAFVEGASLKRQSNAQIEQDKLRKIQRLQNTLDSSAVINEEVLRNDYVGINMPSILDKPGSRADIFLEEGDVLNIPKQLQTVKVSGEVLAPVTVIFHSNRGFKQYISNAGGFGTRSRKKNSYIIYANGSVQSTRKFLFFNNYPVVKPGSEIFVPKKDGDNKLSLAELMGITSGVASLGAIILGIVNLIGSK
ncbi:MAG TPA: SLBB domain-containing protein [Sphingobacteriaceae bacterium]|nr:SLBB domain-containing protein [Sphingobacteriaceae bacterium]